jgi:hypothetical protein
MVHQPITFEATTMPFSPAQLVTGANYSLQTFQKKEPIDQINFKHVLLDWLIRHKEVSHFGNGSFREPVYYRNQSNYQNYQGADPVTYNERDPAKWTDFTYYSNHDGFWFDEDRLIAAGIHMSEDGNAVPTAMEKESLINLLQQSYRALKDGIQENLAYELYRDGSQSAKAAPGLEHLVDWTPAVGTVGGIDAATYTWWQNNADIGTVRAEIIEDMQSMWDNIIRYGGMAPDFIVAGQDFINNFREQANTVVSRYVTNAGNNRGGVSIDPSTNDLFFKGVPIVWDPTLDELDGILSTTTRTRTAYFLNSKNIKLRPLKGEWMRDRKPDRLPDRYVHYFAKTSKYGFTTNKRNSLGVIQIAAA